MYKEDRECCLKFNSSKWDEKKFEWNKKSFIKETIPTLFHVPFPPMIGRKVTKMWKLIEYSEKSEADKQNTLLLFRDTSPFKSEMYMSVAGSVADANNQNISGTFISKVFSGPYNAVPKFIKQMNEYLESKGNKAKDYYIHYAYCPKCAKKYGNNYMVLFARLQSSKVLSASPSSTPTIS